MVYWLALALFGALVLAPGEAQAQDNLVVLIVDPGESQMNQARLRSAIARTTQRSIIRMTDARAPMARGRLTIAFSRPNRWVLRYEVGGQVAWVSDRVARPGQLRGRLAELSRGLVRRLDGETGAPPETRRPETRRPETRRPETRRPETRRHETRRSETRRPDSWYDDVILALQDEIVDPFENEPPRRRRPITVLWSEVIDPFTEHHHTRRATVGAMWIEVLDPWAAEHRRRR